MWDKTVIMNFSGIYPQEPFFQAQQGRWLDMTGMEGVNCYCTPEAEEAIQKQIKEMPLFWYSFSGFRELSLFKQALAEKNRRTF